MASLDRVAGFILLLAASLAVAQAPATAPLTWQEANRRSAALIKEHGPSKEAADLAKAAFDLYPAQTQRYNAENHAQLLLNLADARRKAGARKQAIEEIDDGAWEIAKVTGLHSPVLIPVWLEAALTAERGTREAGYFGEKALKLAEDALGPDDPQTIGILLDVVDGMREWDGYGKSKRRYLDGRERAVRALGPDSAVIARIDLSLAKLELEHGKTSAAIDRYLGFIERLETRDDPQLHAMLEVAYAQLEYAYDKAGDRAAAAETRHRRLARYGGRSETLVPIARVRPLYPIHALRARKSGFVDMHIVVAADGSVVDTKIIASMPPGMFDDAAVEAVKKWKFTPKIEDGKAVEYTGFQRIEFRLE